MSTVAERIREQQATGVHQGRQPMPDWDRGRFLSAMRLLGLTSKQTAKAIPCAPSSVSRWISGHPPWKGFGPAIREFIAEAERQEAERLELAQQNGDAPRDASARMMP